MAECYMCDKSAVSAEHVPPKCLFPKVKDLPPGINLRKALITVPSCKEHNSEKSCDDLYFLNVLTSVDTINEVGRDHYRNQIRRQHARNGSILARFAAASIDFGDRLGFRVEIERLDSFVDHLARALYFAHFGTRWKEDLEWFPEFLSRIVDPDPKAENDRLAAIKLTDAEFEGVPVHGANQQVFAYQVIKNEQFCKMRLHFYGGCRILLIFPNVA